MDKDDAIGEVCDKGLDGDVASCYLVIEPIEKVCSQPGGQVDRNKSKLTIS